MLDVSIQRDLIEKYREILRLRDADTGCTLPDPAPSLRALAARFPGALRELDRLPRPKLLAILAELSSGRMEPSGVVRYRTIHAFHTSLRGALAVKRWLSSADALRSPSLADAELPPEAVAWSDDLAMVRAPPHGKLTLAVVSRLARSERRDEAQIRELLGPLAGREQ